MEDIEMDAADNSAVIEYTPVLDKYAVCEIKAHVDASNLLKTKKTKSAFILCLDKSGSMSGLPIEAVRVGAEQVAKMH